LAQDRFKTKHDNPWVAWIAIGVLMVLVVGLLGAYALRPGRSPAEDAQTAAAKYLNARAWTIFGGTDEVQKNIIAKTVLGL